MRRTGVRPSVRPPVSSINSRYAVAMMDICRRWRAAAASVLHCDPRDENRHMLVGLRIVHMRASKFSFLVRQWTELGLRLQCSAVQCTYGYGTGSWRLDKINAGDKCRSNMHAIRTTWVKLLEVHDKAEH